MWNNDDNGWEERWAPYLWLWSQFEQKPLADHHCGRAPSCMSSVLQQWSCLIWHKVTGSSDWHAWLLPLPRRGLSWQHLSPSTHFRLSSVIQESAAKRQPDTSGQPDRLTRGEMGEIFLQCTQMAQQPHCTECSNKRCNKHVRGRIESNVTCFCNCCFSLIYSSFSTLIEEI